MNALASIVKRAVLTAAAAAALAFPGPVAAKNYYFPEVRIEIAVERDGSFRVDEYRTFEFEGQFSYAFLDIPLRDDRREIAVSEFAVTDEQGRPLRLELGEDGGRLHAKWFYSAGDERRTFHIHYRVSGGIVSYPEVTELYWQAVGARWDRPAKNVQVTVTLPEPVAGRADLSVWGHGPLAGWAEVVDERTARFSSADLAAGQFFEVRVVWPAGMVAGVPSDRHTLASIKAEEAGFVDGTIDRVIRAREESDRRDRQALKGLTFWGAWQIAGPLVWLFFFVRVWSRVGKDYRFGALPEYVREMPSGQPPAFVQTLVKEGGKVTPAAFTATLFDLARRRVLEMDDRNVMKKGLFKSKETVETIVTMREGPERAAELRPHERALLALLFEEIAGTGLVRGASIGVGDFKKYLERKPQRFRTWFEKWAKGIREETRPLGFIEPQGLKARNVFYAVSLPLAVLTVSPVMFILVLALVPFLKRRTMSWASEYEAWMGLRRFLSDFSEFKDIPPEAYKLWESYLVYGILFGKAKKILKMLPAILEDDRAEAPLWFAGVHQVDALVGSGLQDIISSIDSAAMAIDQASASAAHYSSGGGGGFSGGGGGGGGGGGAG